MNNIWFPVQHGLMRYCVVYTTKGTEDYPSLLPFIDPDDARGMLRQAYDSGVMGVLYLEAP